MSRTGWLPRVAMALALAACAGQTRYHHFLPLPKQGWGREDTVCFSLPKSLPEGRLRVSAQLRAARSFPYSDLWLALEQCDSTHQVLHADTLHVRMADSQGSLLGHGCELLEYSSDTVSLLHDSLGKCSEIRLRHLMATEVMPSLTDVGLWVGGW